MDQIVPLTSAPNQQLQALLNVNNATLRLNLTIAFNEMANYWQMDIADSANNSLVSGIPFVTGTWPAANLLQQYQYLNIGSCYIINNSTTPNNDYPDANSLGTDFILIWSDNV